jgi:hypothetical protein
LQEFNNSLKVSASQVQQRSREKAETEHANDMKKKEAEFTLRQQRETDGFTQTAEQQTQQLAQQHQEEWQELAQRHQIEMDRLQKRHKATIEEHAAAKASKRDAFEAEIRKEQHEFIAAQEHEVKELLGTGETNSETGMQKDMLSLKKQIAQRQLALIDQIALEEATIRVNAWSKAQDKLTTK